MSQILDEHDKLNDVINRKEAARFLGICLTTLDRLDIPRCKVRRRVLYKRSVILQYLDTKIEIKKGKK
jgi:hypothetical protein